MMDYRLRLLLARGSNNAAKYAQEMALQHREQTHDDYMAALRADPVRLRRLAGSTCSTCKITHSDPSNCPWVG